jgi:NTP pyrophosphatase (non-canonical NTP hydrolase)
MSASWIDFSEQVHARFIQRARAKGKLETPEDIQRFLSLAICGEAGELANLIKKSWRGDEINIADVWDEIADIRIYLEHLARHVGLMDLDKACDKKIREVAARLDAKDGK